MTTEQLLAKFLKNYNLKLTTAESCTGGLLAGTFLNVPGASAVYEEGYITSANRAKTELLGVKKKTLKKHGAVSKQTAKQMAKGAAFAADADVAISVTGIAGPDGGSEEKPVGLVYIGCYTLGKTRVRECRFTGDRSQIRMQSVKAAMEFAIECIQKALA